eukprot:1321754-Karenia_brevis.AAC.1
MMMMLMIMMMMAMTTTTTITMTMMMRMTMMMMMPTTGHSDKLLRAVELCLRALRARPVFVAQTQ